MKDSFGREIDYMRISVTDLCNLNCLYCMPAVEKRVSPDEILKYGEILRICRCAQELGIRKYKITGGEPLVRKELGELIRGLKKLPGTQSVTLTTNGVLLGQYEGELSSLDGINISLDTLNREKYKKITGYDQFDRVWENLLHTRGVPVKINCVPLKGLNEEEAGDFLELTKKIKADVRFIEMMPMGPGKLYEPIDSAVILEKLQKIEPLLMLETPEQGSHGNGPAIYYKSPGMKGSIGFIGSIHHKFCNHCSRLRLTAGGTIKSCLGSGDGVDLRTALRSGAKDEEIRCLIKEAIRRKPDGHHFHKEDTITGTTSMSHIGG